MRKNTLINLRISQDLKNEFQTIVEREGFTMSQVLEASMKDVVTRNMVPINIRSRIKPTIKPLVTIPFIKRCLENVISNEKENKIKCVSLFGSYAKGTSTATSDIDLLIEVDEGYSLFNLANMQIELEKMLGKKVDLVTKNDDAYFMSRIQKEKIQLYERRT